MIKYRYSQSSKVYEGEIQRTSDMVGSHEVVRAVVQKIANDTGETLSFSVLNPAGTVPIGTEHAEPQHVDNTGQRTIKTVNISEDGGKTWHAIDVLS